MKKVKVHIKKIVIKNKDKINKTWDFKIKKRAPKVFRKIVKKITFKQHRRIKKQLQKRKFVSKKAKKPLTPRKSWLKNIKKMFKKSQTKTPQEEHPKKFVK